MFDSSGERGTIAWPWLDRKVRKWRRRRDRAKATRLAGELRAAAAVLDARMQAAGLTRQARRSIFRECAKAGSFAEVFAKLSEAGR